MPKVWMRERSRARRNKFHKSEDCKQLTSGHSWGEPRPVVCVELEEVMNYDPCLLCYPDFPKAKFSHRYCWDCESSRPCRHNGGVLVPIVRTRKKAGKVIQPGETYMSHHYVWPENARYYTSH